MKLAFPGKIFKKYSNTKFYEYPSSGRRVVPRGRTDRHDEATNLLSSFRLHGC